MSTTIDNKVVSMQFDNHNFEKNANASIGTLEKLKQSLNLTGASKGLEGISAAAGKVNMNPLAQGVQTVQTKFSALQIAGITALTNITNQAVNAGKRIAASLTIDPIKTGFSEYELKMDSVKTIVASTGEELKTVNKYLEELNEYSDQTIYSFSDMTQNIGKFTNAGVKLEDAVMAIKGISNEAAVSGANANEASRAMYNFAQALSSGYVKLIDWKSIENANMATVEFKQQLIDSAVAAGQLTKTTDGMYETLSGKTLSATQNFNDTLQEQWMTSEVLINTLKNYADENTEIGKKAKAAAQDVTKLSQIMDIAKETAQSGWAKTWELLFGDLEKAKALFTPLSNFINSIIDGISDFRNKILESALGKSFKAILEPIKGIKKTFDGIKQPIEGVTKTLEDYNRVVNEVIRGKWGHVQKRWDALTEAGYDWITVQNMVNEKLGNSKRRHTDFVIGQSTVAKSTEESIKLNNKYIASLAKMSKAELERENINLTDDQIAALRQLTIEADKLGMSVEEFLNNIDKIDGRWVVIEGLKNVGKSVVGVFKAMGEAWRDIFWGGATNEEVIAKYGQALYDIMAAFYKFSRTLTVVDEKTGELNETGQKFKRIFKGVFALFDIIVTLVGGPLKYVFSGIITLLKKFDIDVLGYIANLGDAVVKLRDWIKENNLVVKAFEFIVPLIQKASKAVKDWFASLKDASPKEIADAIVKVLGKAVDYVKTLPDKLMTAFQKFSETDNGQIASNFIAGLVNGFKSGFKLVGQVMIELGKIILEKLKGVLDIHSPSREAEGIGQNFIAGLINGIKSLLSDLWGTIQGVGQKMLDFFGKFDWGSIFAVGLSAGLIAVLYKIGSALSVLADPLDGLGKLMLSTTRTMNAFRGAIRSFSMETKAKALKEIAIAIAILAASVLVLSFIEPAKLWNAVGVIAALAAVLITLALALKFIEGASVGIGKDGVNIAGLNVSLITIASAVLLLGVTVALIGKLNPEQAKQGFIGLAGLMGAVLIAMAAFAAMSKLKVTSGIGGVGKSLLAMSAAMLLIVFVAKIAGKLTEKEMINGAIVIGAFTTMVLALSLINRFVGADIPKIGATMMGISVALGLLVLVGKLAGTLSKEDMINGGIVVGTFLTMVLTLTLINKFVGGDIPKIGATILAMSAAMILLIGVAKLAGRLSPEEMIKGGIAIAAFAGIITGLSAAVRLAGKDAAKIGGTVLAMAVAIGILALVSTLLGLVDTKQLAKGVIAIGLLSVFVAGMVAATRHAYNCKENLIVLAAAIAVMAAAVVALSFIKTDKLAGATTALSVIMGMFAIMIDRAGMAKGSIGTLIVMTLAIGVFAGVIYLLSDLPVKNVIGSAVALSLLVLTMSGALTILAHVGNYAPQALKGVILLTAMFAPLIAFFAVLALMQNVKNVIENVNALVKLATVLTILLIPLCIIGAVMTASYGICAIGIAALLAMAVPLYAFVKILSKMEDLKDAEANVNLLTGFLITVTKILVVLAVIGPFALVGVTAMATLMLLMITMGVLAVAIGAVMSKMPPEKIEAWKAGLNNFIDFMTILASGMGKALGALLGGVIDSIMSRLPEIGTALSEFMVNAKPFIDGLKHVDASMIAGVGVLTAAIIALSAADLIEGITSFLGGGSSFSELGAELSAFMLNAMTFIRGAKLLDESSMNGVKALAEALIVLTGANLLEQVTSWLTGESSLATFGAELAAFGPYIAEYAKSVTGIDTAAIATSAEAAKSLIEVAKSIPNSGGWAAAIMGDNELDTFGASLAKFGKGLKDYSVAVKGLDTAAVVASAEAATALVDVAKAIPNSGGWAAEIMGDNELDVFGASLVTFGTCLKDYSIIVQGLDFESVQTSYRAARTVAEIGNYVQNTGGAFAFFTGDNDLATFGDQLRSFGYDLLEYSNYAQRIDIEAIEATASAMKTLQYAATILQGNESGKTGGLASLFVGDTYGLDDFGKEIKKLGEGLAAYYDKVKDVKVTNLSGVVSTLRALLGVFKDIGNDKFTGVSSFASSLKTLANARINDFIKVFSDSETKVKKAGSTMVTKLIDGVKSKDDDFKKAAKSVAEKGADGAADKKSNFKTAGKDLGDGLVEGINAKKQAAYDAGYALGQKAVEGEKDGQQSKSPSKLTIKAGKWLGEGLVIGMNAMSRLVYNSGYNLGESAVNPISKTISRIGELINADIDAQPTIRPVLDLSDVSAGVGILKGMLDMDSSIGLMSNINSIGALSNSRQNGSNDVVTAINKLEKTLSNMPSGDTYNVNGITYDDGSNVSNAVETLIRATRMERRV